MTTPEPKPLPPMRWEDYIVLPPKHTPPPPDWKMPHPLDDPPPAPTKKPENL